MNSSLSQYSLTLNLSKYLNLSHFLFFFFIETSFLFLTTQKKITKINLLITNRLNMINDFLIEIKNYNIIILSKPDLNDEFIKINTS